MATKKLYCIAGASASGKTTVVDLLRERYKVVKSYTTRPRRFEGEDTYHFVSPEEFAKMGQMYAYAIYDGHEYGVPKAELDGSDIYIVEPNGVGQLRRLYAQSCAPEREVYCIYLNAPEALRRARMEKRGDSATAIINRLAQDSVRFQLPAKFANSVIRVTKDVTPDEIANRIIQIIAVEEARAATREIETKYKYLNSSRSNRTISINCVKVDFKNDYRYVWACDSILGNTQYDNVAACMSALEDYMNERAAIVLLNKVVPNCAVEREFYEFALKAISVVARLNAQQPGASWCREGLGDRGMVFDLIHERECKSFQPVDAERARMGYNMLLNRYTVGDIRDALNRGFACIEEVILRGDGLDLTFD